MLSTVKVKMTRGLLVVAALIGLSRSVPFVLENCGCGDPVEIYPAPGAAYCPTSTYPSCNVSMLVNKNCELSCPYPRATIAYRNSSAIWLTTPSIKCEDGVLTNGAGAKITMLMRPTCAFNAPCNNCPIAFEDTVCPAGSSCNKDNFIHAIEPSDGCDRVSCANTATLTLYDSNKNVMPYTAAKLYCTVANKWQNYSLNGNLAGGTAAVAPFTANCILPKSCETCGNPASIDAPSQLPEAFRTGYKQIAPIVNRTTGQCSTVTCPNGFVLMGFVGTAATQTGLNYTNQNIMRCAASGQWSNNGLGYTPQDMRAVCMQKILPCPPVDVILGTTFNVTCDEATKVSSIVCPAPTKLTMRYVAETSTVKYDRATFFAGKGWLAHGCDATASLFTTAAGASINAVCS